MAYFPLNINEELADLLRSATELNGLLNSYVKKHFKGLDYRSEEHTSELQSHA